MGSEVRHDRKFPEWRNMFFAGAKANLIKQFIDNIHVNSVFIQAKKFDFRKKQCYLISKCSSGLCRIFFDLYYI